MSKGKHTPGPWYVAKHAVHGFAVIERDTGRYLAEEVGTRPDANLIAAAPELLEALRIAWGDVYSHGAKFSLCLACGISDGHKTYCPVEVVRAAIAKAEGER